MADERAIQASSDGAPTRQWVFRKETNDRAWEAMKSNIEETLSSLAEQDDDNGIAIQSKRWGDKIIVDFRLPQHRNPKRLLIADISGYTGYPGYQLEIYPRDANLKLPSERVRWISTTTGERILKQLEPQIGQEFTPTEYAEHIWKAIRALV